MRQEQERVARRLLEANRILMAENPDMTLALANTFLAAALWGDEDTTIHDLAKKLDVSYMAVSRHLRQLGDKLRAPGDGLQLVETHTNILNRRAKNVRLTPKGEKLVERLIYMLEGR